MIKYGSVKIGQNLLFFFSGEKKSNKCRKLEVIELSIWYCNQTQGDQVLDRDSCYFSTMSLVIHVPWVKLVVKKVERERPSSLALYAFPASAYQWRNKEHYVLAPP